MIGVQFPMCESSIPIGSTHPHNRIRQGRLTSSKVVVKDPLADEGDDVGLDTSRPNEGQLDSASRIEDF